MKFYSTGNPDIQIPFKEAVMKGVADDGGFFLPSDVSAIPGAVIRNMPEMSLSDIAYIVMSSLVGEEISSEVLKGIISSVVTFPIPLHRLGNSNLFSAELFHGPTGSSKDLEVKFMARIFDLFFNAEKGNKVSLLATVTSDYGIALADAFAKSEKFHVVLIFPKANTTEELRNRITSLDKAIKTVEVRGSVAECLAIMRSTLIDESLKGKILLTSANSINISSLLPLVIQYFYIWAKMVEAGAEANQIVMSVPCGNLANLSAVLIAVQMGLPVKRIIAAHPSDSLINPINQIRVEELLKTSKIPVKNVIITDNEKKMTEEELKKRYGYSIKGYTGISAGALISELAPGEYGAFLATSDPKAPIVQNKNRERHFSISPTYNALKRIIISD